MRYSVFPFTYLTRTTPLHQLDYRVKLLVMIALTTSLVLLPPIALLVATVMLLVVVAWCKLSLIQIVRSIKVIVILGVLVWIAHTIGMIARGVDSTTAVLFALPYPARLLLLATIAQLYIMTTTRTELIDTVRWYLRPWPRVAIYGSLLFMLTLNFIEIGMRMNRSIRRGISARLLGRRHTPRVLIQHIAALITLLAKQTIVISYALVAKRALEPIKVSAPPLRRHDWMAIAASATLLGVAVTMAIMGN